MTESRWNGPWTLTKGGDYAYIRDCNGTVVHETEDFYPSAIPDEYLPLVAAAPDLYEALYRIAAYDDERAEEHLEETGSYSAFDEPGSVYIARAALAKAEGRS